MRTPVILVTGGAGVIPRPRACATSARTLRLARSGRHPIRKITRSILARRAGCPNTARPSCGPRGSRRRRPGRHPRPPLLHRLHHPRRRRPPPALKTLAHSAGWPGRFNDFFQQLAAPGLQRSSHPNGCQGIYAKPFLSDLAGQAMGKRGHCRFGRSHSQGDQAMADRSGSTWC